MLMFTESSPDDENLFDTVLGPLAPYRRHNTWHSPLPQLVERGALDPEEELTQAFEAVEPEENASYDDAYADAEAPIVSCTLNGKAIFREETEYLAARSYGYEIIEGCEPSLHSELVVHQFESLHSRISSRKAGYYGTHFRLRKADYWGGDRSWKANVRKSRQHL